MTLADLRCIARATEQAAYEDEAPGEFPSQNCSPKMPGKLLTTHLPSFPGCRVVMLNVTPGKEMILMVEKVCCENRLWGWTWDDYSNACTRTSVLKG